MNNVNVKKRTGMISIAIIVLFGILCFCCFANYCTVEAYNLNSYDLVDSGKHMDWDGSTTYSSNWDSAVNVWNGYKSGVIRPDAWNRVEDVGLSDYSEESNVLTVCSSNGTIKFNTTTMNKLTSSKQKAVIVHTIGHALGIDNNTVTTSVMNEIVYTSSLNSDDKAAYDWLYKNQY